MAEHFQKDESIWIECRGELREHSFVSHRSSSHFRILQVFWNYHVPTLDARQAPDYTDRGNVTLFLQLAAEVDLPITAFTSAKSRLITPGTVINSTIP